MKTSAYVGLALVVGCLTFVAGTSSFAQQPRAISFTRDEILRLGLETVPAQAARYTPRVRGFGVVTSLAAIAQADSDYRTAEASATFSTSQLARAQRLFALQALSQMAVDTARRQADADKAALLLADRKEAAIFGQRAPWRGPPRNEALLDSIASGDATLIEATFPLGVELPTPLPQIVTQRVELLTAHKRWTSRFVWGAPADPAIPGRNYFALVEHSDLALGEHTLVYVAVGAEISGVRIPADAAVLNEDKAWCYVQEAPGRYRRVPIDIHLALDGGYFVQSGIAPGQPVVVSGASLLLAHELGPATPGGD